MMLKGNAMNSDQLWESLTELSITAGMNQRYYQHMLGQSQGWSRTVDWIVIIATFAVFTVGLIAYFRPKRQIMGYSCRIDWIALFFSGLTALLSLLLVATPSNRDVYYNASMYSAWSDLRKDIDAAIQDLDNISAEYARQRFRDLQLKKNALNERETAPADQTLLEKFLAAEEKSRGVEHEPSRLKDPPAIGQHAFLPIDSKSSDMADGKFGLLTN